MERGERVSSSESVGNRDVSIQDRLRGYGIGTNIRKSAFFASPPIEGTQSDNDAWYAGKLRCCINPGYKRGIPFVSGNYSTKPRNCTEKENGCAITQRIAQTNHVALAPTHPCARKRNSLKKLICFLCVFFNFLFSCQIDNHWNI